MKQASLKFKRYMGNVNIIDNSNLEHHILHILLMSFGALALMYVLILGNMVFNIIERRSLEKEMLYLSSEVGDLGLTYLALSNKVDLQFSYSLGFKEIKPKYATRQALGLGSSSLSAKLDNEI